MNSAKCRLEIDIFKIQNNYSKLVKICKTSKVAAVVKANAYGLGVNQIAPCLEEKACQDFFVATLEEGINLRRVLKSQDSNIYILQGVFSNQCKEFIHYNLIPVLNHLEQIKTWQICALMENRRMPCIIHIDTGMRRLGMPELEIEFLRNNPNLIKFFELKFIMSHLAASEDYNNPYNIEQLNKFKKYLRYFPGVEATIANSSGIFLGNDFHFNMVRSGIALYGGNPQVCQENIMENPLRLTAPIIQLQELSPNNFIGYNMTFMTNRTTVIATLPIGYADGYPRSFSSIGEVFIDGVACPVVGRISMDFMMVDVTDLPREQTFLGKEVEIIGDNCTLEEMVSKSKNNIITYEILTQLGNRFERIYKYV